MGFHQCEYCRSESKRRYRNTSSGDVIMRFSSGNTWEMPDMILHYIADHGFKPPIEFIEDVMSGTVIGSERLQTKGLPRKVGYLSGEYIEGEVPAGFVEKLEALMIVAEKSGNRIQYRGK
jgi:hypothetical protein